MGGNQTKQIDFASKEELWISYYLDELKRSGLVTEWKYEPHSYALSEPLLYQWIKQLPTKQTIQESALIRGHEYTPDFLIRWDKRAHHVLFNTIGDGINLKSVAFIANQTSNVSLIDVKPAFDMNNMTRLFTINKKWMLQKYGIFVQKIIPVKETKHYHKVGNGKKAKPVFSHSTWSGIFPNTFTPDRYLFTDVSNKPRKINYKPISLRDYIATVRQAERK